MRGRKDSPAASSPAWPAGAAPGSVGLDESHLHRCRQANRFPLCLACLFFDRKQTVPPEACRAILMDPAAHDGVEGQAFEACVSKALGRAWRAQKRWEIPAKVKFYLDGYFRFDIDDELQYGRAQLKGSAPAVILPPPRPGRPARRGTHPPRR